MTLGIEAFQVDQVTARSGERMFRCYPEPEEIQMVPEKLSLCKIVILPDSRQTFGEETGEEQETGEMTEPEELEGPQEMLKPELQEPKTEELTESKQQPEAESHSESESQAEPDNQIGKEADQDGAAYRSGSWHPLTVLLLAIGTLGMLTSLAVLWYLLKSHRRKG